MNQSCVSIKKSWSLCKWIHFFFTLHLTPYTLLYLTALLFPATTAYLPPLPNSTIIMVLLWCCWPDIITVFLLPLLACHYYYFMLPLLAYSPVPLLQHWKSSKHNFIADVKFVFFFPALPLRFPVFPGDQTLSRCHTFFPSWVSTANCVTFSAVSAIQSDGVFIFHWSMAYEHYIGLSRQCTVNAWDHLRTFWQTTWWFYGRYLVGLGTGWV